MANRFNHLDFIGILTNRTGLRLSMKEFFFKVFSMFWYTMNWCHYVPFLIQPIKLTRTVILRGVACKCPTKKIKTEWLDTFLKFFLKKVILIVSRIKISLQVLSCISSVKKLTYIPMWLQQQDESSAM